MGNKNSRVQGMVNKKKKINSSAKTASPRLRKTPAPKINMPPKNNSNKLYVVISIALTSIIVGGFIYGWQRGIYNKDIERKEEEVQNIKYDLEEMLNKTKNKLSGAETEKDELLKTNEELKAKVEILNIAKREFNSEEYGFSFFYPAVFGEVTLEIMEGDKGKKLIGKFSDNDELIFGGISNDYSASSSAESSFTDTQGFRNRWGGYFYKSDGNTTYQINPLEVIRAGDLETILINKNSFNGDDSDKAPFLMEENIGLLVNLQNEDFAGIGFLNSDISRLPLEDYISLAKTFRNN